MLLLLLRSRSRKPAPILAASALLVAVSCDGSGGQDQPAFLVVLIIILMLMVPFHRHADLSQLARMKETHYPIHVRVSIVIVRAIIPAVMVYHVVSGVVVCSSLAIIITLTAQK